MGAVLSFVNVRKAAEQQFNIIKMRINQEITLRNVKSYIEFNLDVPTEFSHVERN